VDPKSAPAEDELDRFTAGKEDLGLFLRYFFEHLFEPYRAAPTPCNHPDTPPVIDS
jgi:hypothetical protein